MKTFLLFAIGLSLCFGQSISRAEDRSIHEPSPSGQSRDWRETVSQPMKMSLETLPSFHPEDHLAAKLTRLPWQELGIEFFTYVRLADKEIARLMEAKEGEEGKKVRLLLLDRLGEFDGNCESPPA